MDYATFGLNLRGLFSEAVARSTLDVSTYSSLLSKLALLHRPLDRATIIDAIAGNDTGILPYMIQGKWSSSVMPEKYVRDCSSVSLLAITKLARAVKRAWKHEVHIEVDYSDSGDEELEAEELDVPVGPDVAVETECEVTDSSEIGHYVTRCALEHGSAAGMVVHLSLSSHTNALCSRVALESCEDLGHDLPGPGVAADVALRPSETACLISHRQFCPFLTLLCGVLMVKVVCSHLALSARPEVG